MTNLKRKFSLKKIKIVISSIMILLNGFIWSTNAQVCFADISVKKSISSEPSITRCLGFQVLPLDSWKKSSCFSWQALQTFFKHSGSKTFKETKWESQNIVNPNRSFNHFSSLIEKISELRKCRINPRIQLEKIFFSGVRSFLLKNNFPKDTSIEDLVNNTIYVLKSNGFNKDNFRKEEPLQSLVNYLPGLNFLTGNYLEIPLDVGKGFTMVKIFSGKGSPFNEKILSMEYSCGFNVLKNSSKATEIQIKDARKHLSKKNFSIKQNKEANFCKIIKSKKGLGLKISNFTNDLKKKTVIKDSFKIETRLWKKIFDPEITEKTVEINNFMAEKVRNSTNYQKTFDYLPVVNSNKIYDSVRIKKCMEKNHFSKFNRFKYLFNKSLKINKKISNPFKSNLARTLKKRFAFLGFKKKKKLLLLNSKDRIIKINKEGERNNLRLWEANRIVRTFNLHSLNQPIKRFYPQNLNRLFPDTYSSFLPRYQLFGDKIHNNSSDAKITQNNFRKILVEFLEPNFDKSHFHVKENIILSTKFRDGKLMTFNINKKKNLRLIVIKALIEFRKKKQWTNEIFNFSAGLNSIKTEDWKTSISLLHKIKSFKNPKALNLLGTALRFGNELPKSAVESQKLHTKSAQLGNMSSQTVLATYLTKGLGIKKSKKHAFLILNKTAHEGISTGVYNFITMLKNGVGVKKDILRAFRISEYSKQLIEKGRRPFKRHRKINKCGFFKILYSYIRSPNEIKTINFYLQSLNSPLTSDLSAFIFENAQLISSGINIMNISEKKGSFVTQKKLQNLFLENRQQYLFHETLKGSVTSISGHLTELIFKWNIGIGYDKDYLLFKNLSYYEFLNENIFHKIKIIQNNCFILFNKLIFSMFKCYIQFLNLPVLIFF